MRLDRSLHAALARPKETLSELDRLDCEASLARFFRLAWSQIEPGIDYVHGWHSTRWLSTSRRSPPARSSGC
jgi:hypothetical protein